jgi:hypothetical protein
MVVANQMGIQVEQYRKNKEKLVSRLRRTTKEKDEAIRILARERPKAKDM